MTVQNHVLHLLRSKRFLPLFLTQFLGAANDNVFKNALVILIVYRIAEQAQVHGQLLVTLAAGLFILPFFLFSATAGQLADKFEKGRLIRLIKASEIVIMGMGAVGFATANLWFLLTVLFLMGTQSTFFGPLKYAILPDHLREDELIGGNALVEAGTFLAILFGTIAGGVMILTQNGVPLISGTVLALALAGWAASLFIPHAAPKVPDLSINWNFLSETRAIIRHAAHRRDVFLSILGISWFWLVGATFLAQFPTYAKDVLGANEQIVTLFLTVFSVGIGIGSLLCGRLLDGEINAKYVPYAALGMSLFSLDLYLSSNHSVTLAPTLAGLSAFLDYPANWRVMVDLLLIAVCGGIYIVPLYAIVQARSDEDHRARTIASNNVINALFMVISALGTMTMFAAGFTVTDVFLAIAIANAVVAVYIVRLLPHEVLKAALAWLFRQIYRVEVRGLEHYRHASERTVIVANHVSFLDAALLAAFLPGMPTFAINTHVARRWWIRPFLTLVDALPIDPTNPLATRTLAKAVKEGRRVVIFPEGRITVTGALMKIYEGPGLIADKAQADILPVRIEGAQYTPFSRLEGKMRLRLFPKITLTVLPPQRFEVTGSGRERRQQVGARLYDMMSNMLFTTANIERTLYQALLDARTVHGGSAVAVEDVERRPLTYRRLIAASRVLGAHLKTGTNPGEYVGVLLPNSSAVAATFFGLHAYRRIPAMLNFSTGAANMRLACQGAAIRTVITSRRFIQLARLEEAVRVLEADVRILYLEDVRARMGLWDKLHGLIAMLLARALHRNDARPDDPAVVLFTSGSEGTPKGVVLSHRNILANCAQLSARIDFNPTDSVFNALPVFHSFGLTGGLILPLFSGIRTFLYPSPLHYRIVPELTYDTNVTILFGTDTFLRGYARAAHPYDFYSVRLVFAGAERLKEETRRTWMEKFGVRILEGYGATETSPVLACNTPMHYKPGTVGRFLPGIRYRLEPVPGIEQSGRLVVSGPNVMLGYLRAERPGVLDKPAQGWYDTGDIVTVDDQGYITIVGRAKRFAKIAGEMVSLSAVENYAATLWPEHQHAVVSVADGRKGEQLVLITEQPDASRDALLAHAKANGVAELMIPRVILPVKRLPLLGSGKVDYAAVKALIEQDARGSLKQSGTA